ncbi:4Fe-4S dicluster domain-containing protein [Geoglobus acetivorans]|uniref:4Fe-4S dicluster domain-containing protein n=1 Tax=Geoglobus acetivorans TaxID=565033 RepID=A0ABZ3H243_GEOAI|nr:4Fe-4S dicluster domain-containing protein [Geoglobus acetivorans]
MTSEKYLMVFPELCTGCRECEIACSLKHDGVVGYQKSRIRVIRDVFEGIEIPVVCMQCIDAPCMNSCRVEAIYVDENGAKIIDYEKCIGCRRCIVVCPLGANFLNPETGKPIKCDLCDGDPVCVKFCSTGAVRYLSPEEINSEELRLASKNYIKALIEREM